MKKITMICMAAMLLLAASCKKEKEEINEPAGEVSVFSVETEVHSGDSKTHLEGARVIWDSNDAINVINGNNVSKEFTFSKYVDGGDGSVAEFKAENLPADFYKPNYTGYYPSDFNPSSYSLPRTQTYSANGFVAGSNPMIATNEAKRLLHFKNVLGILELQLKSVDNSMTVKEIRVRSNVNEMLWGTGSVVNGEFKVSSGGSNTVKLNCGSVAINSTTPTSFFILLPPGTLSGGFEVDVVDTDGEFWITKTVNSNEIIRSRIRRMPAQSVKTCTCEDVQLWPGGPYWATKNLGAENPWNYGDYYQWGVSPDYYGDGIPTLYDPSTNRPPQSGKPDDDDEFAITFRDGVAFGYTTNSNCPYYRSDYTNRFSKYNSAVDGKTQLDTEDDIAYQLTNKKYRMPNNSDFNNLIDNTVANFVGNYHNVAGQKLNGKDDYDDRFIFLPRAGYVGTYGNYTGDTYKKTIYYCETDYWSSTVNFGNVANPWLSAHCFSDMDGYPNVDGEAGNRWFGLPVRPIKN